MSDIIPDTLTIVGSVEYESAEEVLEMMSSLKEISSLDGFNNQVVNLEAEEPAIAFSDKVDDRYQNSLTLQSAPSPDQLPEEPPELGEEIDSKDIELDTLALGATFVYDDVGLLISALGEILEEVEEIDVQQFYFSLSLEEKFNELSTISRLDSETDFDITGVQFMKDSYVFSFQKNEDSTEIFAVFDENGKIDGDSVEEFIEERLQGVTPVIEQICYEN